MKVSLVSLVLASLVGCAHTNWGASTIWQTSESVDDMTGKIFKHAEVYSTNTLPTVYSKKFFQMGRLSVVKGTSEVVFVSIDEGLITCEDDVLVKFDDKLTRFKCRIPDNSEHNTVAIIDSSEFISEMKNATTARIRIDLYRRGSVTLDFNVSPFPAGF